MHKINIFKILIFITISLAVLDSCKETTPPATLPAPNDSLANSEAIKAISREIESSPENPELYYRRAQIYSNTKYLNRAEADLHEAIRLDSLNPLYHFVLGRTEYAMNQTKKAAASFEKAIELKPEYLDALLKLADLYFVVKEHQKSLSLLNRALKIDKGNAYIYHMLGMNYKETGDTARAIYHFQTAIETDPSDYESTMYVANLYAASNIPMALDYYKAAIRLKPRSKDAWFGKAVFEQKNKMEKQALLDYRKVIEIDPENYLSYYNVGYLNYENGFLDEAVRNWDICIRMNNNFANAYYMKGLVMEEKGKKNEARLNYNFAFELDPANVLYKNAIARIH